MFTTLYCHFTTAMCGFEHNIYKELLSFLKLVYSLLTVKKHQNILNINSHYRQMYALDQVNKQLEAAQAIRFKVEVIIITTRYINNPVSYSYPSNIKHDIAYRFTTPGVVPVLFMFLFPTGFLLVEAGGCSVGYPLLQKS